MNGVHTLTKEAPQNSLSFFHMVTVKRHHLGKRASFDTESAGAMILAFPSSGSVMHHCSLFISHLVYGIF